MYVHVFNFMLYSQFKKIEDIWMNPHDEFIVHFLEKNVHTRR